MPLSGFHPAIQQWFAKRFGEATAPQRQGWPLIRAGRHALISAPTGTGKTLAAYLSAIDSLARQGPVLADETSVLYVSPLRALSNDVQKNLQGPLGELAELDPNFPKIRVTVRTGDTSQRDRSAMRRTPPHILVTTPESLYILLTSNSGRKMLATVKTVIIDEIHALARDKRGSHLALSLERLEALAGSFQRIGLSATQKPLSEVARFLVGVGRECEVVDVGHRRDMDVSIVVPPSPLETVCSHEQWDEIYGQIAELINAHRTTLIFVNTRKMAERITARLTTVLGQDLVTCHHSSLSRQHRLDAEQRLKAGTLRALVATASLELGIDIGDVDLVIQVGATRSIATFLQRVGRSGHAVRGRPKGRLFPLTIDELIEAAALLRAAGRGELDRTPQPAAPLDILAQQIVAACVPAGEQGWSEDVLFDSLRRAWPYRDLKREDFDTVIQMHTDGRRGLLHRDAIGGRIMARKRARITAITGGGAIPDVADYKVLLEPEGTFVGTLNEDFAVEANVGDIFQLGNTSWRILRVSQGAVRVADAKGQPPSIPFWLGEGASRTMELSREIGMLREDCLDAETLERGMRPPLVARASRLCSPEKHRRDACATEELAEVLERGPERSECKADSPALPHEAAIQIADFINEGRSVLGAVPTQKRVILERFFDESGGMQMVLHAPFGGRINRAWGLALRKRFCRGFGFELQAAANEEAIIISLGTKHSFPLEDVFNYLHPNTARKVLTQAVLDQPMFESRWRWNATRSLVLEKFQGGKKVPPQIMRMRAGDLLAAAFPAAVACPENLPPGDLPIPMEHPLVRQTIDDCLSEATDIEGLIEVLTGLRDGTIERVAIDTPEPSAFARGILNSELYTFLDDAPLEERRTQAVYSRRSLNAKSLDGIGALDPDAVQRVREEAWPRPENAEEVHDALLWMGFITDREAVGSTGVPPVSFAGDTGGTPVPQESEYQEREQESVNWLDWLTWLATQNRVIHCDGKWSAVDGPTDPKKILLGRLEALGPVSQEGLEESVLLELEHEGHILRTRLEGQPVWCERRLLARIHRYTLDRLRREIEPVTASEFLQFLACWQHVDAEYQLEGPHGVGRILRQLAGVDAPAWAWESHILPRRVRDYRREWLDEITMGGEFAWGRLWGGAASAIRITPISFVPREDLDSWLAMTEPPSLEAMCGPASDLLKPLRAQGAMFPQNLQKAAELVPAHVEMGLADLLARGLITCDSFAALRQMLTPPSKRRHALRPVGRWSCLRQTPSPAAPGEEARQNGKMASSLTPSPGTPGEGWGEGLTEANGKHPHPNPLPDFGELSRVAYRARGQDSPRHKSGWSDDQIEKAARQLLARTGVVFRKTVTREKLPISWLALSRAFRRMELRGEIRGGRFVAGFSGEQFALPEAIELLRNLRRQTAPREPVSVICADPLNFQGILTPEKRMAVTSREQVLVG